MTPAHSVPSFDIWAPVKYNALLYVVPALFILGFWFNIVYVLYWTLLNEQNPFIPGNGFIAFFILLATYPVVYIINQFLNIYKTNKQDELSGLDPYYGFCTIGPDSLTENEIAFGAVGALDYKCHSEQYKVTKSQSKYLISSTYYVVHALFALVLFFFTQSAGRFKDIIMNRKNVFVVTVIRYALVLSLLIMGCTFLGDYYYLTMVINYFLLNVLQVVGTLMLMLISFILYKITFISSKL